MFALSTDKHQIETTFNVGIYTRLSREDGDSVESESIANQKEYLTSYALEQGWNIVDVFVDDGYTGTNFNRPDFIRLKEAIERREINLVITKDLSRLGRDYIDTGHYLERYFPTMGVRYIALNDGIDTFAVNSSNNDMSPFRAVINDSYARDTSRKVRTTMNVKRERGLFIGAFAPYGYLKSPLDKNRLLIDPQAAPVVKRIFEMYLKGAGFTKIAHILNDEGILSPSVYKKQSSKYSNPKCKVGLWTLESVKVILTNPTYAGHLTQHKFTIISYKVKKLKSLPREAWVTVENTHEAIVSPENFETVQQLIATKSTVTQFSTSNKEHLLGGLLYCKDCGSRMTYTKTQKGEWYAICSNYKRFKRCTRHSYHEESLQQYIIEDLKRISNAHQEAQKELLEEFQEEVQKRKKKQTDRLSSEFESCERRLEEIKKAIKALYEDKLRGLLTERDFIDLSQDYNKEREKIMVRKAKLSEQVTLQNNQKELEIGLLKIIKDLVEFNNVSKILFMQLINRVEVTEDKQVHIYYKFKA